MRRIRKNLETSLLDDGIVSESIARYLSLGMSVGLCFGIAIGAVFDSVANGLTFGLSTGMVIGVTIGYAIGVLNAKNGSQQDSGFRSKADRLFHDH